MRTRKSRRLHTESQSDGEAPQSTTNNRIYIESSEGEVSPLVPKSQHSSTSAYSSVVNSAKSKLQKFAFQPQKGNTSVCSKPEDAIVTGRNRDRQDSSQGEPELAVSGEDPSSCSSSLKANNGDDHTSVENTPSPSDTNLATSHPSSEPQIVDLEELEKNYSENSSDYDSEDDYSPRQKEAILNLLNSCTEEEVCGVPGCSITKARLIVSYRPFESWDNLVRMH